MTSCEDWRREASHEGPGQTLEATGLVHEAYLKLVDVARAGAWQSRSHFFAAAAEAMHRILVDRARKKRSLKRGGDLARLDFDDTKLAAREDPEELLAVDEAAIDGLAAADPQAAELVKLRYFTGLAIPEVAQLLNISPRSADRLWAYARAWLRRAIERK